MAYASITTQQKKTIKGACPALENADLAGILEDLDLTDRRDNVVVVTQADSPVALTAADSGKVYVNKGATGAITFNLPPCEPGLRFTFLKVAVQDIVLQGFVSRKGGIC